MTPEQIARNKRRNEHFRLVVTFFNLIGVGIVGLAVVGPLVDQSNPLFYQLGLGAGDKLTLSEGLPLQNVIPWPSLLFALGFHVLAHIITVLMRPEE